MKKHAIGFAAGIVMILALNQIACGQVSPITCDLFQCQAFLDMIAKIDAMKVDTEVIAIDLPAIKQDLTYAVERVVAIDNQMAVVLLELAEIKSNFPITVVPDPAINARLDAIDAKLDILIRPEASIWSESISDAVGIEFQLPVWVRGESLLQIDSFGLHINFNVLEFQFIGVYPGDLTSDWADVNGNEATPGDATIGGYAGSGSPSVGSTGGILFALRLKGLAAGTYTIALNQYVDGIANMSPAPLEIYITIE